MATIGQALTSPEAGWRRYEVEYEMITHTDTVRVTTSGAGNSGGSTYNFNSLTSKVKFTFLGTKLLIRGWLDGSAGSYTVTIDGVSVNVTIPSYSTYGVLYIKEGLQNAVHNVEIKSNNTTSKYIDTIDIDENGIIRNFVNKILISSGDGYKSVVKNVINTYSAIPVLTSNTSSSVGIASASSINSATYDAWRAFDKDNSSRWVTGGGVTSAWLKYSFSEKKPMKKYVLNSTVVGQQPKSWTLEGSNDNVNWTILDNKVNVTNWSVTEKEYEIVNEDSFLHFRLNITSSNGTALSIIEMRLIELEVIKVVLIGDLSEQNFINYGMDKPIELDMTTVFTTKEIINEDGSSTIIETEPFTLADEFEGKQIKALEYTDNPSQVESKVETEVEPYSIYDEFGNTMEVLYYTDDATKTKADLEITANYSPLDEINGDFEVVTWSNAIDEVVQEAIPQLTDKTVEDGTVYATPLNLENVVSVK